MVHKEISKKIKYNIYNKIIKSIVLYRPEVWKWTKADKRRLIALEMNALQRSCRISWAERIPKETIKQIIGGKGNYFRSKEMPTHKVWTH